MVCRTVAATRTTALARAVAATRTAASYRIPCDLGGSADYYRAMDSTDNLGTDATFTRASTQTVVDHKGVLQTCAIDEAGITGGRRIAENNWSELDAAGDPINPNILKGRLSEAAGTNSFLQSRTFDTTWVGLGGTPVLAQDQIGIDGVANTAWTLTDNDVGALVGIRQTVTIPNDSNTSTATLRIKKVSGATGTAQMELVFTGGTVQRIDVQLDVATGVLTQTGLTGTGSSSVELVGDFWVITSTLANNTSGNAELRYNIYPSAAATTGSIVIDWAQLELNKSFASSPILTTTGSASRFVPLLTYPNPFQQNDMCGYIEFTPSSDVPNNDEFVFSIYGDTGNDRLRIRYNAGNFKLSKHLAGVVPEAAVATAYTKNKTYKISWRISTGGMKLWVDGAAFENTAADAKTGVVDFSGLLNIASQDGGGQGGSSTKEYMVWYKVQSDEFLQAITR